MNKAYKYCPVCTCELIKDKDEYQACCNADCTFVFYNNPTPVVAAIVEYEKNQVIIAHNVLWPPKWYGLITGFVEEYENPDDTVLREVKEELGLDGVLKEFVGHYTFNKMNQLIIAYHVEAAGEIMLNEELDHYKIIPFDKAKTWPSGTGLALRDFLRKKGYDPEEISFS
ncbi:MAG: NUDIX hydrolase [Saprospiraceae bacterium]